MLYRIPLYDWQCHDMIWQQLYILILSCWSRLPNFVTLEIPVLGKTIVVATGEM